jgi:hypothetical protein
MPRRMTLDCTRAATRTFHLPQILGDPLRGAFQIVRVFCATGPEENSENSENILMNMDPVYSSLCSVYRSILTVVNLCAIARTTPILKFPHHVSLARLQKSCKESCYICSTALQDICRQAQSRASALLLGSSSPDQSAPDLDSFSL